MQRIIRQGRGPEHGTTAQARFASGREGGLAQSIGDSPALVAQRRKLEHLFGGAIQRQAPEEEEPLQGKLEPAQRVEEEEMPLQGKFEAEPAVQREEGPSGKPNDTGLPDTLKSGIESLSGVSMDSVKVHYNSPQPAQLNALAYAQGTDIHVAPGQEKHLPHEAWHVVQQAQGRVKPTMQMKEGVPVNDDAGLEQEADVMGDRAMQWMTAEAGAGAGNIGGGLHPEIVQRMVVLNKPAMTGNFVELTSIDYALKRAGEPFSLFKDADFSGLDTGDMLYFVAHGSVGQSGSIPTDQLIARLLHPDVGLKKKIGGIVFTSCYAGKGSGGDDSDSVVTQVSAALHDRFPGIPVIGARGPSVKSDQTGNAFTVWDKSKTITLPSGLGVCRAVSVMETIFTVYYGPDFMTQYAIDQMDNPSVDEMAETASEETGHFYEEFQDSIKKPSDSITLNMLISGAWNLEGDEYQDISDRLGLSRKISVEELKTAMRRIQEHATLALKNPMNVSSS